MSGEMEFVLVEDNEEDASRIIRFLRANFTNTIHYFQDGAEAARFLIFGGDKIPKLILLDLVLPSVDGIELFRIIRAEPKERQLVVVMLISSASSKDYLDSIDVHPDGYLRKPVGKGIPARCCE